MLYIQNQWSLGKGKLFKSMNPLTGEIVWEGNFASASQLNAAMHAAHKSHDCLLYTSPSPRDQRGSRMPSSA